MELREIGLSKIKVGEANVRKHDREVELDDLAKSIERWGVLQPVVVFPRDDRFELIVGQRRLLACKRLGKKNIPAVVVKMPDEVDAKILSVSENIQRTELNYADQAEVVGFLYEHCGKSVAKVAKLLGKSQPYVSDYLKIDQCAPPEVKKMLANKDIGRVDATKVARIAGDDAKKAVELAKHIKQLTKNEKKHLVDLGRRKPELPAPELLRQAKRRRVSTTLVIPLVPALDHALEEASTSTGMDREEIGKTALTEWLGHQGFLTKVI